MTGSKDAGAGEVAGEVAIDIALQLVDPVRALRDRLGLIVDHLERHVATSTGPTPYPWRSLQILRQDLAGAYLESTHLARRLDELDRALHDEPPQAFDASAAVDLGLRLAGDAATAGVELVLDLGDVGAARGAAGTLALIVAQMVGTCARSARALAGSSMSVRVARDGDGIVVVVADNGDGDPGAEALGALARGVVSAWGGSVEAASASGRGCAFEIRLCGA